MGAILVIFKPGWHGSFTGGARFLHLGRGRGAKLEAGGGMGEHDRGTRGQNSGAGGTGGGRGKRGGNFTATKKKLGQLKKGKKISWGGFFGHRAIFQF